MSSRERGVEKRDGEEADWGVWDRTGTGGQGAWEQGKAGGAEG